MVTVDDTQGSLVGDSLAQVRSHRLVHPPRMVVQVAVTVAQVNNLLGVRQGRRTVTRVRRKCRLVGKGKREVDVTRSTSRQVVVTSAWQQDVR